MSMASMTSSGRLAHEMSATIDGRFEDSDEESDWDRYSYGEVEPEEDERFSSGASGMATPVSGSGGRPIDSQSMRRVAETSIFGLTDKRRLEPLRWGKH
jgi:hypothetical protein